MLPYYSCFSSILILFTEQTRLEKCLDRILLHPVDSADFITSPGIQTRPYGCHKLGFKTRLEPSQYVLQVSGQNCLNFTPKANPEK